MSRKLLTSMFYEVLKNDYAIYTLANIPSIFKYQVLLKLHSKHENKSKVCLIRHLQKQKKLLIAFIPRYKVRSLLNIKLNKAVGMLQALMGQHCYCVIKV